MLIPFFRTLILFFFTIFSMRFMGKRQVGEMQPAELVITILISAVASVPMQDIELPLLHGIVPILTLISAEVIISSLSLRFPKLRHLVSGRPITVIKHGVIDQKALRKLRMTIDDLLEDLRLKDVYDLRTVRLAQVETNGSLSVLVEARFAPPTAKDMNTEVPESQHFETIISDGKIVPGSLDKANKSDKWLSSILRSNSAQSSGEVFYLASDGKDGIIFALKDGN